MTYWLMILSLFLPLLGFSQTIAEKKASLIESGGDLSPESERFLKQINLELNESRQEERKLSEEAYQLYLQQAPEEAYQDLLVRIRNLRYYIATLQESWREMIISQGIQEGYALWYQPETTLEQLIIDYGAQDYVYVMKPEVGAIKISVNSDLPIPRSSWNEMLEFILTQNGVGIRQLNPFLRELYLLNSDHSAIKLITNRRDDLDFLSPESRIAFVLTPEPSDVRRIWFFLDNFANHESTAVQLVGRDIILIAKVTDVQDLLRLYDFVSLNRGDKEYKAITLSRVKAEDMAKVLQSVFNQTPSDSARIYKPQDLENRREVIAAGPESNGLQVLVLGANSQALFLIGTKEEVRKAEDIIKEVQSQMGGGAREKIIYWYTVRHSDAAELAEVLSKVYMLMVTSGAGYDHVNNVSQRQAMGVSRNGNGNGNGNGSGNGRPNEQSVRSEQNTYIEQPAEPPAIITELPALDFYANDPYFLQPVPPVSPSFLFPARPFTERPNIDQGNFIVDLKTGSIVMVVEAELLPKIKELIAKLDVPKLMVQLEVLLFEKRIAKENNYGLNLLKLGSAASNTNASSLTFKDPGIVGNIAGIFDFILSRKCSSNFPAFDLIYRFLLSQDEVTINANPSVLTVNQTPAFIAIEDEISINTGVYQVETSAGVTLKDAFQRAQYGTTLKIIPTIHLADEEEGGLDTITLDSDITFDTFDTLFQAALSNRPNVTRRNVKNIARVADGETVIIGGLRRKTTEDSRDSIPFIGEIPGIGKLFSDTNLRDNSTEMFIMITPKIVVDPACDLEWIRTEELMRRPGDVPEFMCALIAAQECEKNRLFEGWLTTLFGRPRARCYSPAWHNSDTCASSREARNSAIGFNTQGLPVLEDWEFLEDCEVIEGEYDGH